jgi:RNA polymerase sigma-70 factor, ECF subfamily
MPALTVKRIGTGRKMNERGFSIMMETDQPVDISGKLEARYLAFLETVSTLRPSLHRYCARMTGSIMDGEDVVQEALIEAYRKLDKYDESRPLKPWLFRIAHNRSIDFLRRKGVRDEAEAAAAVPEAVSPAETATLGIGKAVEQLVASLPPKERACILLKDVFDYSLEEIAELVDSTVGGVKAALNRGRIKLASSPASSPSPSVRSASPELAQIMQLYVDRFNRRDWDGVRELISADARLNVLDRFAGKFADAPYFFNYDRWPWPWKLAVGEADGEPVLIVLQRGADTWTLYSVIRMKVIGQEIEQIVDYIHCPWMIPAATSISLAGSREMRD